MIRIVIEANFKTLQLRQMATERPEDFSSVLECFCSKGNSAHTTMVLEGRKYETRFPFRPTCMSKIDKNRKGGEFPQQERL
jgi:hypothetical protein